MFCRDCGEKLTLRFLENEGLVPYCTKCESFKFPFFPVAVSMTVVNRQENKILLARHTGEEDFKLFALPLGENVACRTNYDSALAEDCLIKSGFGERLKELPAGLDTYLYKDYDSSGVDVSGGEAQKIAIARSLYKDAPFIILDEPTAALDAVAEAEIYSKFDEIAGDKTAIYISHRLSSCKFCDEIAVFDGGAVVQCGSHEQLVADETGKYFELWHAQAQYYAAPSA